jgi:hypothetical protein
VFAFEEADYFFSGGRFFGTGDFKGVFGFFYG